jgi:hypothetical protein
LPTGAPASLLVGSQALVTLYSQEDLAGRSETFAQDDRDLLENSIGRHQASSAVVTPASQLPSAPSLRWPASGQVISTTGSLDLVWADGGGGREYQAQLNGPMTVTSPWLSGSSWNPTMPSAGAYTWRVRARNSTGIGGWSPSRPLSISAAALPPGPLQSVPWSEGFESGAGDWLASGGWAITNEADLVHGGVQSFHIPLAGAGTQPRAGDLTSPPISISQAGLALRFWYRYQTEGPSAHWDQRWLQISVNGGAFSSLLQLADDPPDTWLQSPIIDLGPYQGSTIRLRFHFNSLDEEANTGQGWAIDDLTIAAQAAFACLDPQEPNPNPSQAAAISYGSVSTAAICPPGDLDFYIFQGTAGDRIAVDIDAETLGSPLDAYLYLLDADGTTILAENDDEVLYVLHDPHLGAPLPATGNYYLKVRAWNHPGAGGETFTYTLNLERDLVDPTLLLVSPGSGQAFNTGSIPLEAAATDLGSGIRNVAFYWHAGDWQSGQWELLLDDRDPSDGWGLEFDPTLYPEQSGAAFLARAYDWAGNQANAGAWELTFDRTAPVTTLDALAPTQGSTAFQVSWDAMDNLSGLAGLDLESQTDLSAWTAWQTGLDPDLSSLWFIGEPDRLYGFRMRGVDVAGNVESFPAGAETSTLVLDCSAPDAWEPDDLQGQANALSVEVETQQHNFCERQDVDWLKIQGSAGEHYRIWAVASHPSTAVSITLYAPDGTTILDSDQSPDFGELATVAWKAQADGWYLAKFQHVNGAVGGNDVSYRIWVQSGYRVNLPLTIR